MAQNGVQSVGVISQELESRMAELQAKTQEYGLGRDQFVAILNEVGAKYLTAGTSAREREEFFASLRLDELALARACAAGHERAWEIFMVRYREKLCGTGASRLHLWRSLRHERSRGKTDFEAWLLHRPRFARRLAAHSARARVRQPLQEAAPAGEPGRRERGWHAVCRSGIRTRAISTRCPSRGSDRRGFGGFVRRRSLRAGVVLS